MCLQLVLLSVLIYVSCVEPQGSRVILLMDVSADLQRFERKDKLLDAAARWIEHYAPDGIMLSLMKFSLWAEAVYGPAVVNQTSRRTFLRNLPLKSEGESYIHNGIQEAVLVGAPDTILVILTDGFIADSLEQIEAGKESLKRANMTAITVILGNNMTDESLLLGTNYQVHDRHGVPGLLHAMLQGMHSASSSFPRPVVLLETVVNDRNVMTEEFLVDSTASSKFSLTTSAKPDNVQVHIQDPSQNNIPLKYAYNHHHLTTNGSVGKWRLDMESKSKISYFGALVTADGNQKNNSIQLHCLIKNDADLPSINAFLYHGNQPIRGANITAELSLFQGLAMNITLFDNGVGADARIGDGEYSRFIPPYLHSAQWFSVLCSATGNIKTGNNGKQESFKRLSRSTLKKAKLRTTVFQPLSISDLNVSKNGSSLFLSFTAPGAQLDWARASEYQLLLANTTDGIQSAQPHVLENTPKEFGNLEGIIIPMPKELYIALKVKARTGLESNISNIVELSNLKYIEKNEIIEEKEKDSNDMQTLFNKTGNQKNENVTVKDIQIEDNKDSSIKNLNNIKVPPPGNDNEEENKNRNEQETEIIIILAVIFSVLLAMLITGAVILRRRREAKYEVMRQQARRRKTCFT